MKNRPEITPGTKKILKEAINYGIYGIPPTLLDVGLLYALKEYLGLYYLLAALIAFVCGITLSYILNINYVFKNYYQKKLNLRVIGLYTAITVVGIAINEGVIAFSVETFKLSYLYGKFIAVPVVVAWNFLCKKGFIFNSFFANFYKNS